MSEQEQQRMVVDWLEANRIKFCAVPNAGKRSAQTAAKLRAEGMRTGVPDLIILTPPPAMAHMGVTGVAIEMKSPGRGPTGEQHGWLEWFCDAPHWTATVCYDAAEAVGWLKALGYGGAP